MVYKWCSNYPNKLRQKKKQLPLSVSMTVSGVAVAAELQAVQFLAKNKIQIFWDKGHCSDEIKSKEF